MDDLQLGKQYDLYRDGQLIGRAVFTDTPEMGECFIGEGNTVYFEVDDWKEVTE